MSMSKETSDKLEAFRAAVASEAEDIVFRIFPTKIIELSTTIKENNAPDSPYDISQAAGFTDLKVYPPPSTPNSDDPSSKRKCVEDGIVPSTNAPANAKYPELVHANPHISKLQENIREECTQLSDFCDKVRLWVNLTMPKIEDGNNFGVEIQEHVVRELQRSQENAYNIREDTRNHWCRAAICGKLIKYPNVEDYTLALKEHDERQLVFLRQNVVEIRNIYATITDTMHKNIAKIRSPKGDNSAGLY